MQNYLKILRYYRNVEFFRVFDLDEVTKRQPKVLEVSTLKNPDLWGNFSGLNPDYEYAFDYFFWVFSVGEVLKKLTGEIPGVDSPLPDYRSWEIPTKSCVGRVGINSDGEFDLKDISLSTFPWASNETRKKRKLSVAQFDLDAAAFLDDLEALPNADSAHEKAEKKVTHESLKGLIRMAVDYFLKGDAAENHLGVLVPIRLKRKKDEEIDEDEEEEDSDLVKERDSRRKKRQVDILNSFYLRDLERAAASRPSKPLSLYFSRNPAPRVDVVKDEKGREIVKKLAEQSKPGRWLFSSNLELATNQKAAISLVSSDNSPLIGINGPPGTGKTTIIKDLLAQNIVDRAKVLMNLESPNDAFQDGFNLYMPEGKDRVYKYRKLIPSLCNAGIIVASSNNGAIENITKEFPLLSSVDSEFAEASYLREPTKSLRFSAGAKNVDDWWGLISLPLGKYKNRKIAANGLIWGEQDKIEARKEVGAQTLLEWRNKAPGRAFSFRDAKLAFKKKLTSYEYSNTCDSELFILALSLHEAWIREVPNLENELKLISSLLRRPSQIPSEVATPLWEVLFMISPLISTTLASVERMFGSIAPESFALCVIDEAGQALPQTGVGLLMRCRKALVMGDQRQLMPISSLPKSLDEFLQNQEELIDGEKAHFCSSSIQSLADSQTELGTYIGAETLDPVWIGLPLTSHRRCDEPMFSISNKISYDNIMEFQTPKREPIASLGESCWFDVKGEGKSSHWVPAQGALVQNLLRELLKQEPSPDCFFITPFRAVKDNLYDIVHETITWERPDSQIISTLKRRIGTIHTFQGREADIVFLILGCDWSTQSAADWAGETPNLCNVAITRAKRFLYVIGDIDLWHRRGVFSDLQKGLEVKTYARIP